MFKKLSWERIAVFVCLIALLAIILAASFSRTVENSRLTKVMLSTPFQGTVQTEDETYRPKIIRVRTAVDLMLEDVYIKVGDEIKEGEAVASVYIAKLERDLAALASDSEEYRALLSIKENGYKILAQENGTVTSVPICADLRIDAEAVLFHYLPKGEKLQKFLITAYPSMVPLSALTKSEDETYQIFFAIPLSGRGESGQYIVTERRVKILASDGKFAAIDLFTDDGRKVIVASEKPLRNGEKVREMTE